MEDLLKEFLWTWNTIEDGKIQVQIQGKKIFIDKILTHQQLGISSKGTIDISNASIKDVVIALKRIPSSNVFVENKKWSLICMKKELHPWFVKVR